MDFSLPDINIDQKRAELQSVTDLVSEKAQAGEYEEIKSLSNKQKKLETIVSTWNSTEKKLQELQEASDLLEDPELGELATLDVERLQNELPTLIEQLESLTTLELDDDEKNAIFEIRAGTGGTEASLFAEEIMRMYVRYANSCGYRVEQISTSFNDEGGIKEASFGVIGDDAFGKFRFESGVHRVQRVPDTESSGRIHTSAISVVVLPETESKDVEINESDLRIEVFRSSGPGGQSVNTTDSAVRITHIPTGISVSSQDSKSQHQNKERAMMVLASKLYAIQQEEEAAAEKSIRSEAIKSGDRSVKIRTYNFPQGRVTDHRIPVTWYNLSQILEGELDNVVDSVNTTLRKRLEAQI